MEQTAFIVSVSSDNSSAEVLPMITGACLSCKERCAQRGNPFTVVNKKNLELKEGSVVTISASKTAEAVQSLISLFAPVLGAVAMFFLAPLISQTLLHREPTEGFKAMCSLAGIVVPAMIAFAVSRFKIRPAKPYIEKVF